MKNQFATNLYNNLMNLCEPDKYDNSFYFADTQLDGQTYRIFNYRLVGYTVFSTAPDAKKCRGTMFNITDTESVSLVCLPPDKFFNYAEGSVNHTVNTEFVIHEKLDGSLISTYMHLGELKLKSKGSLTSTQALESMEWLDLPQNKAMKALLTYLTDVCYITVNMEWTGPQNRIVVGYEKPELRVISFIQRADGTIMLDWLTTKLPFAKRINIDDYRNKLQNADLESIVNYMYKETVGEGYVISFLDNGVAYQVKIKNETYCNMHKIKDSVISRPKELAHLIINGNIDDVYSMFIEANDTVTLKLIKQMEDKIIPMFNQMIIKCEKFYYDNKELDRKSYALLAQKELPELLALVMQLYVGRNPVYNEMFIKIYSDEITNQQ